MPAHMAGGMGHHMGQQMMHGGGGDPHAGMGMGGGMMPGMCGYLTMDVDI